MKNSREKKKDAPGFIRKARDIFAILIIITIIVLIVLSRGPGFGNGSGNGSGNGGKSIEAYKDVTDVSENDYNDGIVTTVTEVTENSLTSITSSEPEKEIVEVTVSGHDYLYMNKKTDLAILIEMLKEIEKDVEIRISSDNTAAMNTMEDLTEALDKNGFTDYYKLNN